MLSDNEGKIVCFNPTAQRILGLDMLDVGPDDRTQVYGCYLPDTVTPFPPDRLPLARALRGEVVTDVEQFSVIGPRVIKNGVSPLQPKIVNGNTRLLPLLNLSVYKSNLSQNSAAPRWWSSRTRCALGPLGARNPVLCAPDPSGASGDFGLLRAPR